MKLRRPLAPLVVGIALCAAVYSAVMLAMGGTVMGALVGIASGGAAAVAFYVWLAWDDRRTLKRARQ